VPAHRVAVVGDDPDLEVPMAHRGRALAIAVCTGSAAGSFGHLPAARGPHLTVAGVDELLVICPAGRALTTTPGADAQPGTDDLAGPA
jgi:hypothetical protein